MKTILSISIVALVIQTSVLATTNFWNGATVISGDCTNGFAKVIWDSGQTYDGYFENNLPHGFGKMFNPTIKETYFGTFKNGLKDGIGIRRGRGDVIGEFKEGKRVGSQLMYLANDEVCISKHYNIDDLFKNDYDDDRMLFLLSSGDLDGDFLYQIKVNIDTNSPTGVYIPKDLNDCFIELDKMLHPELVTKLQNDTAKDLPLFEYHMGLGMWLRNNWGLWKGSHLTEWFLNKGITHPDNMSGIIYRSYTRHLQEKAINLEEQIKDYKKLYEEQEKSHKQVEPIVTTPVDKVGPQSTQSHP